MKKTDYVYCSLALYFVYLLVQLIKALQQLLLFQKQLLPRKKSDAAFIVGVGKGLEKRWELAGKGDAMSDEEFDKLTLSEYKELYKSYVDAELNEIGNLDGYQFENSDLNDLANDYMNCLQLQKNSVDSFTEKSTNNSPEWIMVIKTYS